MMPPTFAHCSLYYLNQWLAHDLEYHHLSKGNRDNRLAALKKAAVFYGVARNLPLRFDEEQGFKRYQPVLQILDTVDQSQFKNCTIAEIVKKILEIENRISEKYGDRNVLSLATKFLWLKVKQPILIYDSRARSALETNDGDLDAYYKKWWEGFKKYQFEIKKTCCKLPKLHLYAVDKKIGTKEYITKISSKSWFHERVFDIYLWTKGRNT